MSPAREQLGPYKLLRVVGRGGMSVVYEGFDPRVQRRVAIKVLHIPPHLASEEEATTVARLEREARVIGRLSHPNVVSIYDIGEDGGFHYLVMEFIEGITLRRRLDEQGPLSYADAAAILNQTASALDAVHAAGVVHRDLKPSNVMLVGETDLRVKLLDFGVARPSDEANVTQSGFLVGTPSYLSPEQVMGDDAGPASDLWSLGVLLYEMLSCQTPFTAGSMPSTLLNIVQEPPAPLPGAPEPVQDVINFALDKHPQHRFASGAALAGAFKYALKTAGLSEQDMAAPVAATSAEATVPLGPSSAPLLSPEARERFQADTIVASRPDPVATDPPPAPSQTRRRSAPLFPPMAVAAAVALGILAFFAAAFFRARSASPTATPKPARPAPKATPSKPAAIARTTPPKPVKAMVRAPAVKPTPSPTPVETPQPLLVPATPTASPSPRPTPRPTPTPQATPRPAPTPVKARAAPASTPSPSPMIIATLEPTPAPETAEDVKPDGKTSEELDAIQEEDELRELLGAWVAAMNARDTRAQMEFYPQRLNRYYTLRNVPRVQVRADKQQRISQANRVDIRIGEPRITFEANGDTAVLRFRKDYHIEDDSGTRQGAVLQELRWRRDVSGYWKIISERDLRVLSQQ